MHVRIKAMRYEAQVLEPPTQGGICLVEGLGRKDTVVKWQAIPDVSAMIQKTDIRIEEISRQPGRGESLDCARLKKLAFEHEQKINRPVV